MNDLDKKLKTIVVGASDQAWIYLDDDVITDIKRAFIDAGYIKVPKDVEDAWRVYNKAAGYMTGEEWYDAYKRELGFGSLDDFKDMNAKSLDAINITEMKCDEAAKRASGLERGL